MVDHQEEEETVTSVFHRQRLETLGMLAGGIAHDFNNVLAGILGHITYLKTILPSSGNHTESLQAIEDGARKASLMTRQILDFSKLDLEERPVCLNLTEIVQGVFRLLKGATSPRMTLDLCLPADPVHILGVEGKVAQIIVNLVINARDAISEDGRIDVSLSRMENSKDLLDLFGGEELSAPAYALIEVRDSGHGMSQAVLDRIFEPYFSTKEGKGTGLGLATVLSIVKQLAGAIDIVSQEGEGTSVSVYLPLVHQDDATPEDPRRDSPLQRGTERVLIVDDEYPVRNVLAMSLGHLGYEVETVSSGVEALALYEEEGKRYDLIILDMLMPKLSGEEVFRRIRQIDPEACVLVISGYSSEAAVDEILANGGKGFIQKPFTIDELSMKVRECLDGEA
ncbi:MAG: response regulator [Bdellovibrionales bacterium]|nr:response regulator [Bdellovibrionales bacterium]